MATLETAAPFGRNREAHAASRQNMYTVRGSVASTEEFTFRNGALVGIRPGDVRMVEVVLDGTARADLEIVGVYEDKLGTLEPVLTLGANDEALDFYGKSYRVNVHDGDLGDFDTASSGVNKINPDDVGKPCFAKNDNTLYLTDAGGTLSFAGLVAAVSTSGKVTLRSTFDIRQQWKLVSSAADLINLGLSAATELTIASGAVAVTQSNHTIDTEADAASDNLDTITGMVTDQVYVLSPANSARTVVLRDFSVGAGNIRTPFGQSISLAEDDDYALAISDGTDISVIGFRTLAANGGGAGAIIGLLSSLTTAAQSNVVAAINEVKANAIAAPVMQTAAATLVAGTATINTGVIVAAGSEVIPIQTIAITGSANFGSLRELKASRVNGIAGVGTIVIEAVGNDGAKDVDAAGAFRVVILTPQT